ncbi:tubulin-tyrosine ligase [Naviculisporaceae sp. PSN 640]
MMEVAHTPSPRASVDIHTPPAPAHGFEDSWAPYSPRKSARISQRAINRTPSPTRSSSRRQLDQRPTLTSPKPTKRNQASSMATPAFSPQKKRTPATESSRRATGVKLDDVFGSLEPPRGRAGASSSSGMLITPAKTPQKPPTEQNKAKVQTIARNLFHNDAEVMPSPKKVRAAKYAFDSFCGDDEVDEPIQIYTDSVERIPEVDRSSDNPFYINPNVQTHQHNLRRSKRQMVTIPGEGQIPVDEAVGRSDGMLVNFRGKVTFRKYADHGEQAPGDRDLVDGADGGLESVVETRITRSTVQPRLLFPAKKQVKSKQLDFDEDEEAITDIEDHVLAEMEEHEKPSTPVDFELEEHLATPKAPQYAPASPPTTARTTRFGTKKAADATPKAKGRGKRSPFDGWRRTKGGVEGPSNKRTGDDSLPTSPVKRARNAVCTGRGSHQGEFFLSQTYPTYKKTTMHILVVNDDGPPSPHSSPYVHSLVRELQAKGHTVSVCLPHTQRSWIGKAHMIGQTVKPLYYRPPGPNEPAAAQSHGTTHTRPSTRPGTEEWILVDGTPASCVQIGLYHFFKDRGPVDLVVSGPNYGRNTTAVFALSSGTLGGALEAAVCRRRAIALSYAFFTRNHDTAIIQKASRQSVRVIEALWKQWPTDGSVDLYSVNVPLLEGLEEGKVLFTPMLQNYWGEGSCFTEVEGSVDGEAEDEERIREGESREGIEENDGEGNSKFGKPHAHKHFKWSPRFTDVYKSVEEAPPGNDGWTVKEGHTSITPLKANFWQAATAPENTTTSNSQNEPKVYALVDYGDDYVQPLILSALKSLFPPNTFKFLTPPTDGIQDEAISLSKLLVDNKIQVDDKTAPVKKVLQITPYETLDFEYASSVEPGTCLINSYMIRKALIRKHFLTATVENWTAKHPDSVLKTHVKRSESFEVDYAEFLDDSLVEAFDLRASLERNEEVLEHGDDGKGKDLEWWILKPSMSDRGQGIRLFATMEQLQGIFDGWEVESDDEEEEDGEATETAAKDDDDDEKGGDGINTSHLRHFVAQPYIHPPMLLPEMENRKFHIRTYVLCVGSMKVYVYRDMLALFAAKGYQPPSLSSCSSPDDEDQDGTEEPDLEAHLTNTCLQHGQGEINNSVHRFWSVPGLDSTKAESILEQICQVTGEIFEAAARGMMIHFQPLENAFEVYGLDFLVDDKRTPWLLEVNAFPDFKQTGGLKSVVSGFWEGVVKIAVGGLVGLACEEEKEKDEGGNAESREVKAEKDGMVLVRDLDLGRRWG